MYNSIYKLNLHKFLKNISNSMDFMYTIFKTNVPSQFYTFNVHNLAMNIDNFVLSMYIIRIGNNLSPKICYKIIVKCCRCSITLY